MRDDSDDNQPALVAQRRHFIQWIAVRLCLFLANGGVVVYLCLAEHPNWVLVGIVMVSVWILTRIWWSGFRRWGDSVFDQSDRSG